MPKTAYPLKDALATDSTAGDYTAKVPTATEPSGDGIIDLPIVGQSVPSHVFLQPFGTDAANEIFAMRVWGWSEDKTDTLWIPSIMIESTCTLGNIAGSKGTGTFICDTLVVVANQGDTGNATFVSPTGDVSGYLIIPTNGVQKIEFDFNLDTGAAANCMYRFLTT